MQAIDISNQESFCTSDELTVLKGHTKSLVINAPKLQKSKIILDLDVEEIIFNLEDGSYLECDSYAFNNRALKIKATLDANATLKLVTIASYETKDNIEVSLNGDGASFDSRYLSVASDFRSNIQTKVIHNAKHTNSHVSNYGISLANGGIDFNTTGQILRGNSGSICEQLTRGIIASRNGYVRALPILLIDEYDVKANHGASIGKMSDDELFYLMSRGLTKQDAFRLILSAIINPFLEGLLDESYKDLISKSLYRFI